MVKLYNILAGTVVWAVIGLVFVSIFAWRQLYLGEPYEDLFWLQNFTTILYYLFMTVCGVCAVWAVLSVLHDTGKTAIEIFRVERGNDGD